MNELNLDIIALDLDAPNLEQLDTDFLKAQLPMFQSVADQYPNNPLNCVNKPEDLPEELDTLWECRMAKVGSVISTAFENQRVPSIEVMSYIEERFKARVIIYDALTLDVELLQKLDISEVRYHRGYLFINVDNCDIETIKHLEDDILRRIEEMKMFFDKFED